MPLFNLGDFKLHSGGVSRWKIDCDALTADDWAALALMLAERLPPFGWPLGVPRGGLPLARALERYATPGHAAALIVDDVCSTGASMEAFRRQIRKPNFGAVVFSRGPTPDWVTPLFRMTPARTE
jgi:hypothetical protein